MFGLTDREVYDLASRRGRKGREGLDDPLRPWRTWREAGPPESYPMLESKTNGAYANSSPRIVPVEDANLSVSKPSRCNMDTNKFGSG